MKALFAILGLLAAGSFAASVAASPDDTQALQNSSHFVQNTAPQNAAPEDAAPPRIAPAQFITQALPSVNFVNSASRLAIGKASSAKIRNFAQQISDEQALVARSLAGFINKVGPIVTARSAYGGATAKSGIVSAGPPLLPAQVDELRRLSAAQGRKFDALYISTQMDALQQLAAIYNDFITKGDDPSLHAIAARELPKVQDRISALKGM